MPGVLERQAEAVSMADLHLPERKRHNLRKGPLTELRRPGNQPAHFGSVRFPASKRPPAKWVAISHQTGGNLLLDA